MTTNINTELTDPQSSKTKAVSQTAAFVADWIKRSDSVIGDLGGGRLRHTHEQVIKPNEP